MIGGGGGQRVYWPPPQIIGGGLALPPTLPTPMIVLSAPGPGLFACIKS